MQRVLGGILTAAVIAFVAFGAMAPLKASAPSGAIFTTVADGTEVNYNIYQAKEDVYLDGGPGPGAPQGAAGLDDGVYVFQVTDPSGKTLLSTDAAGCRLFTVSGGIIVSTAPSACPHVTGSDVDHNALTVQLMPFNDTPNNGGEYKVWVTMLDDYQCNNDLSIVDCGPKKGGSAHGFVPRHTKTDNFKVRGGPREIDTRFTKAGSFVDGVGITWTDPLGASNVKWSYENLALDIHHEAHVEAVENGTHSITVANQAGCVVGTIFVGGVAQSKTGPQTITVKIDSTFVGDTLFIDVSCQ
jgi:hypothetical protein